MSKEKKPDTVKNEIHRQLFESMFMNMNQAEKEAIKPTFMQGGYYSYDISQNFTIVCLNSLYWNTNNVQFLGESSVAA